MHAEHAVPKTGKVCVVDGYHLRDPGHVASYVAVPGRNRTLFRCIF